MPFACPAHCSTRHTQPVVTDRNGTLLGARIAKDGQWRFPPLDSVPYKMRECLICFEDKRFTGIGE